MDGALDDIIDENAPTFFRLTVEESKADQMQDVCLRQANEYKSRM